MKNLPFVSPETYTEEEIDNFPDYYMPQIDLHLEWISTIKANVESIFRSRTDVYVAGDIYLVCRRKKYWYSSFPDVMRAFRRSKEQKTSYKQ